MKLKELAKQKGIKSFDFLCSRNPIREFVPEQINYVMMLMQFEDVHGELALDALAGAYLWAIENKKGEEQEAFISQVFCHDLGGRNDKLMLPRSSSYVEFWEKAIS